MRVMLAAIHCERRTSIGISQPIEGFSRIHRASTANLVVFPEFSLTGLVDAVARPERAVEITDERISELVRLTSELGVGAVFGLGERTAGAPAERPHIIEVVAVDGAVGAVQRKRHIADDEAGFGADVHTTTFDLGGHCLGTVICAESTVDLTWQATVAAGADVVVFCSAPGLDGRRTGDANGSPASCGGSRPALPMHGTNQRNTACGWRWRRKPTRRSARTSPGSPTSSTRMARSSAAWRTGGRDARSWTSRTRHETPEDCLVSPRRRRASREYCPVWRWSTGIPCAPSPSRRAPVPKRGLAAHRSARRSDRSRRNRSGRCRPWR